MPVSFCAFVRGKVREIKSMETKSKDEQTRQANREKYLNSHERKKYSSQPSKIFKVKNFRRRCASFVGKNEKILDIGGGAGIWTDIIREAGITNDIYAVDISENILKERNEKDVCKVGDMEHLPFSDGFFDRAIFFAALHHVEDTKRALSEAARVVKPGGHVVLYEPISVRLLLTGETILPTPDNVEFYFSIRHVLRNIKAAGLEVSYIQYEGFLTRFLGRKASVKALLFFSRVEELIEKIPFMNKFFNIFADVVTIVAKKS